MIDEHHGDGSNFFFDRTVDEDEEMHSNCMKFLRNYVVSGAIKLCQKGGLFPVNAKME